MTNRQWQTSNQLCRSTKFTFITYTLYHIPREIPLESKILLFTNLMLCTYTFLVSTQRWTERNGTERNTLLTETTARRVVYGGAWPYTNRKCRQNWCMVEGNVSPRCTGNTRALNLTRSCEPDFSLNPIEGKRYTTWLRTWRFVNNRVSAACKNIGRGWWTSSF